MRNATNLIFGDGLPSWMSEPFDPLDWDKLRMMLRMFWTEIAANEEAKPYLAAAEAMGRAARESAEREAAAFLAMYGEHLK